MKRRTFIRNISLASLSVPFFVKNLSAQATPFGNFDIPISYEDRILVLIRMNGGNDGLNTVIPLNQYDNLTIQRPNIIIPESKILRGTTNLGFHPSMTGINNLFQEGRASIIQGVGYAEQNRSHFRSSDIWTNGSTAIDEKRGWLGRYFEQNYPQYPDNYPNANYQDPFAMSLGRSISPTCQGSVSNFSTLVSNPNNTFNLSVNTAGNDGTMFGCNNDFVSTMISQTNVYGSRINQIYDMGNSLSKHYYIDNNPQNDYKSTLAKQMRYVAQMIAGGMKTKVYILNVNGFDTHGQQVDPNDTTLGTHADLLQEISDAVYAFEDDLSLLNLDHRVMGMSFSEFGRQIASNGSRGTDHGDAAPLFLFGKCISKPIIGFNPTISTDIENQKGVDMQFDFRDIYASVLQDWLKVPKQQIEAIFPDHSLSYIKLTDEFLCSEEQNSDPILLWPNPTNNQFLVDFYSPGGQTKLNLIDSTGKIVKQFLDQKVERGRKKVQLDVSGISPGYYRVNVYSLDGITSTPLIIQ
ncbi:MAG: DUF1501 domain-containing protein [Crocinitomicaceae bacterium]|nr:DUF1501 domain-containing protein [Crocinitomicaceae bacterium]MDG1776070.1 DUF1501 domain-containing protein [Crocinitomicaceae bacterium]